MQKKSINIESELLKKAQLRMLEILIEVDKVCRQNNINYWLDGGTLLGAVRHGGFIPWDDDIDISMLPEDYKKFLIVAPNHLNKEKYFLATPETDKKCWVKFAKVRDRNSLFVENVETNQEFHHQGIYIDVFPMRFLNETAIKYNFLYSKLLRIKDLNINYGQVILKKILVKIGVSYFANKILNKFFVEKNKTEYIGYKVNYKNVYNVNDIFPLSEIIFEGYKFLAPKKTDIFLTSLYGDYMKLPKENERQWHSKEIYLDRKCYFEKNIEETGRDLYR